MTALEVIATILAVLVLVKIAVVLVNPGLWIKNVAGPIFENPPLATAVYAGLAIVVGYFVFASLTVVEVAAVMAFTALLMGVGMLPYAKPFLHIAEEMAANKSELLRNAWLSIVIYLGRYLPLGPCLSFCLEGKVSPSRHQSTEGSEMASGAFAFPFTRSPE
jgi:hypothetical protein